MALTAVGAIHVSANFGVNTVMMRKQWISTVVDFVDGADADG